MLPALGADSQIVSTYCRETEVPLDGAHSSSKLGTCSDDAHVDLLWHLDRIDQLDGNLDGRYHRRHTGAGSVVYIMDTGVLASHAEFTAVVNISGWVLEKLASMPDPSPVSYAAVEKKIREMIGGVDAQGRPDASGKRFFFVVAGNNIDNGCGRSGVVDRFPAILGKDIEGLITVGGMTEENSWWPGACRGGLEILAPSEGIFSATITANDHYRGQRPNLRSGTSFAAPIISGIAARMLSEYPSLTPQEIESAIESTHSRIFDPDASRADGKVAFVQDAPAVMTAQRVAP